MQDIFVKSFINMINKLSIEETIEAWEKEELNIFHFKYLSYMQRLSIAKGSFKGIENYPPEMVSTKTLIHYYANPKIYKEKGYEKNAPYLDSNCPAEILEVLSFDKSSRVRAQVASHKNSGHILLQRLADDENEDVRYSVAGNPNTNHETLVKLSEDNGEAFILACVALNKSTPVKVLERLSDLEDGVYVTQNPSTPWDVLRDIYSKCDNPRILLNIANNPNTINEIRTKIFDKLILSKDKFLLRDLAGSDKINHKSIVKLFKNEDILVRLNVAVNELCPKKTSEEIIKSVFNELEVGSADSGFLEKIISSRNCPQEITEIIVNEKRPLIDRFISNKNANPYLIEFLVKNQQFSHYHHILANSDGVPSDLLETLAESGKYLVMEALSRNKRINKNIIDKIIELNDKKLICNMLIHVDCPKSVYERFLTSKNSKIREAIASSPYPKFNVKLEILDDPSMAKFIRDCYFPEEVISALGESLDEEVREASLMNSNHPDWMYTIKEDPEKNPWFTEKLNSLRSDLKGEALLFQFRGKDANKCIRSKRPIGTIQALVSEADITSDSFARASKSTEWLIRMAVARNHKAPPDILRQLKEDSNQSVAKQASMTLESLGH